VDYDAKGLSPDALASLRAATCRDHVALPSNDFHLNSPHSTCKRRLHSVASPDKRYPEFEDALGTRNERIVADPSSWSHRTLTRFREDCAFPSRRGCYRQMLRVSIGRTILRKLSKFCSWLRSFGTGKESRHGSVEDDGVQGRSNYVPSSGVNEPSSHHQLRARGTTNIELSRSKTSRCPCIFTAPVNARISTTTLILQRLAVLLPSQSGWCTATP
jgi:hypothetical protein